MGGDGIGLASDDGRWIHQNTAGCGDGGNWIHRSTAGRGGDAMDRSGDDYGECPWGWCNTRQTYTSSIAYDRGHDRDRDSIRDDDECARRRLRWAEWILS